jgi:beta-phosphoglucomutase
MNQTAQSPNAVTGVIFDIDGVLVDSPHEAAWRQALKGFADPARLTGDVYQADIAGRPRLDGARAALRTLGVPDADARAEEYAVVKQAILVSMIEAGKFAVYDDGRDFLVAAKQAGLRLAAASSSKNANRMLGRIRLPGGGTMLEAFDANVCGIEVPQGKPAPDLFLAAAAALGLAPERCVVIEDAGVGIQAALAGGMRALGIARHGDRSLLDGAGAELVVTSLAQVALDRLGAGRLECRQ